MEGVFVHFWMFLPGHLTPPIIMLYMPNLRKPIKTCSFFRFIRHQVP
jgi:hypothetical protein